MSYPIRSANPQTSPHLPSSHPSRDAIDRTSLARGVVSRKRVKLYDSEDDPDDVETSDRKGTMYCQFVEILTDESPGPDGMSSTPNLPRAKAGAAPQTAPHADNEPPAAINASINNSFNRGGPAEKPSSGSGYSSEFSKSTGTPPVFHSFNSSFNNYRSLSLNATGFSNSFNRSFNDFDPAAGGGPDEGSDANSSMALERTPGRSYR